jgi:hypothetical protein
MTYQFRDCTREVVRLAAKHLLLFRAKARLPHSLGRGGCSAVYL